MLFVISSSDSFLLPTAMSENYVVFIEQPVKIDILKIVTSKMRGKALGEGIYWDPKQDTVFHLVNKSTGEVRCDDTAWILCMDKLMNNKKHCPVLIFCTAGQLGEVPHQSVFHLPSDQRL